MTNENNENKSAAITAATAKLRDNASLLNAIALTTAGPHADAALFLAQCMADAQRSADSAEYATPSECADANLLLQLAADIRAVDEARAELDATVAGLTVTVTDSGGLTWTNRVERDASEAAASRGMAAIWTARSAVVSPTAWLAPVPVRDLVTVNVPRVNVTVIVAPLSPVTVTTPDA
jgi:hypothetical protein